MIVQNDSYISGDRKRVDLMNEVIGRTELTQEENRTMLWISELGDDTVERILSVIRKTCDEKVSFERSRVEFEALELKVMGKSKDKKETPL